MTADRGRGGRRSSSATPAARRSGAEFHPIYQQWELHSGQDLVSLPGRGPVVAAAAGTVSRAGAGAATATTSTSATAAASPPATRTSPASTQDPARSTRWRSGERLGVEGSTGTSTGLPPALRDRDPRQTGRPGPVHGRPRRTPRRPSRRTQPRDAVAPTPLGRRAATAGGRHRVPLPAARHAAAGLAAQPAAAHPAPVKTLYLAAAARYKIPWTLLAGIGMEETGHGRNTAPARAGAQGLMQFLPATFARWASTATATAAPTSATTPTASSPPPTTSPGPASATAPPASARPCTRTTTSTGTSTTSSTTPPLRRRHRPRRPERLRAAGNGNPDLPPLTSDRVADVLAWAKSHAGDAYVMGANGPTAWDCSSFTQAAYARIGISMPRTAAAQRSWLAAGNGTRIPPGQEKPGDLIFWDSYLGPNQIGHVMIVWNPATKTTIEARSTRAGIGHFTYADGPRHHIFEIWRVGNMADRP